MVKAKITIRNYWHASCWEVSERDSSKIERWEEKKIDWRVQIESGIDGITKRYIVIEWNKYCWLEDKEYC